MRVKSRFVEQVVWSFVALCSWGCSGSTAYELVVEGTDVECHASTGEGKAPNDVDTQLPCSIEFLECSDGRSYTAECVSEVGTGSSECSCLIDGAEQSSFTANDECPIFEDAVISGCKWSD
jgi:hypothetical protein